MVPDLHETNDELTPEVTGDGSSTLHSRRFSQGYHSRHGAVTESRHVFIDAGLRHRLATPPFHTDRLRILELGLGTGLNALLTLKVWQDLPAGQKTGLDYVALEPHPIGDAALAALGTAADAGVETADFSAVHGRPEAPVHAVDWGVKGSFTRLKLQWQEFAATTSQRFDLIYFDAFAPGSQPELWTEDRFGEAMAMLDPGGVLVTYCAKGAVRRAMAARGFLVERLPGPPGKREMLRATHPGADGVTPDRFNVRAYFFLVRKSPPSGDHPGTWEVLLSDELIAGKPCTKWPGGGVEFGEGPMDCVRREAEEELGQSISVGRLIHATGNFIRSAWRPREQVLCHYYLAALDGEARFPISTVPFGFLPGEEQSLRWAQLDTLRPGELTFETDRSALEALRSGISDDQAHRGLR